MVLKLRRQNRLISFLQTVSDLFRPDAGFIKMKKPYKISWLYISPGQKDDLKKISNLSMVKQLKK